MAFTNPWQSLADYAAFNRSTRRHAVELLAIVVHSGEAEVRRGEDGDMEFRLTPLGLVRMLQLLRAHPEEAAQFVQRLRRHAAELN